MTCARFFWLVLFGDLIVENILGGVGVQLWRLDLEVLDIGFRVVG